MTNRLHASNRNGHSGNGRTTDQQPGRCEPTAAELQETIFGWIRRRTPSEVIGPPGVGKTYAAKAAALRAQDAGLIKTFEVVTGCKDLSPDHIFECRLVISESAERYVHLLPSMIRKHCAESLRPVARYTPEAARRTWKPGEWLLIILDEATRCTPTFIDGLLPLLDDFQVTIEGETFYAPVLVILLGNPAGMDGTTTAFTHALTSRLFGRVTMYQPGPEEMAVVYTLRGVRDDAEEWAISARSRPTDDQVRLACGVITLLWGLPLDRKGIASLSAASSALLARVECADSVLAGWLHELGELTHFGPDPRKGRRWAATAMDRAAREEAPFDLGHLIETAVECLSIGGKDTFSEGQEPHLQRRKEDLIYAIVGRVFRSEAFCRLILEECARAPDPSEPSLLAAEIAGGLFRDVAGRKAGLERLLREHDRRLEADAVPDREQRRRNLAELLRRAARLDAGLPRPEGEQSVRHLAKRADSLLIGPDGFVARADLELLDRLDDQGGLTPRGEALARLLTGPDQRPVPLALHEEVRLAVRDCPDAEPFASELAETVRSRPAFRGRVGPLAAVLAAAIHLEDGADVRPVLDRLWSLVPPVDSRDMTASREAVRALFAAVAKQARPPYRARFEQLRDSLEDSHGLA